MSSFVHGVYPHVRELFSAQKTLRMRIWSCTNCGNERNRPNATRCEVCRRECSAAQVGIQTRPVSGQEFALLVRPQEMKCIPVVSRVSQQIKRTPTHTPATDFKPIKDPEISPVLKTGNFTSTPEVIMFLKDGPHVGSEIIRIFEGCPIEAIITGYCPAGTQVLIVILFFD